MRIRVQKGFWTSLFGLAVLGVVLTGVLVGAGIFTYYYFKYSHLISQRFSNGVFQNTTQILSAPERIAPGQALTTEDALVSYLQQVGYHKTTDENSVGQYSVYGNVVDVRPSRMSYFGGTNALAVQFNAANIQSIRPVNGGPAMDSAEIEPELVTNLFDSAREKRRIVTYDDIPPTLLHAILSAEDKRFFEHGGFDFFRIFGAAWADLRHSGHYEGASTITMQVARTYFLSTERTWERKLAEAMVSIELEQRFSKKQIFEMYANDVYLGNRGSFGIRGFEEASYAYFGKDMRQLSLGECAFLGGIVRAPNYYSSSDRHPERALQARDRVLTQMVSNKYITQADLQDAKHFSLHIVRTMESGSEAPYFVDMVKDHLLDKYSENDLLNQNFRVYTTLDPALQHDAVIAVANGMKNVDNLLAKKYERWRKEAVKKGSNEPVPQVQVALVALDPRTGEIKALVGGRDYGQSQLNHAVAHRQPGSVFKPFVYAAAFDNAVDNVQPIVTPSTTIVDEPTTFDFDGKEYTPNNFGEKFMGTVTVRQALTNSLNVATVKVAEMIGYGRVVDIARQMGLGANIQPTPAVALGAYEMTPVEVAAGYTAFADGGMRAEPQFIRRVEGADGSTIENNSPETRQVLDPRVAFLVTSLMEDVMNHGTAAGVRARGFTLPAAGKTGTSRDGWFSGFTSNLICVIWIGFDDNRDLGLAGGVAAAPIWADFMIHATQLPAYHDAKEFAPPEGVQSVLIDRETGELASASCPDTQPEYYIAGTAPTQFCGQQAQGPVSASGSWLSHIFGGGQPKPPQTAANAPSPQRPYDPNRPPYATGQGNGDSQTGAPEKKKNVLQRIFGAFGSKKNQNNGDSPNKPPNQEN